MATADVVVALPGANTCAEARVVGRHLLLLDVMPGHGRDNLLHELELDRAQRACHYLHGYGPAYWPCVTIPCAGATG